MVLRFPQTIILTGFEPEIVLSSIRTLIQQVENTDLTDLPVRQAGLHSENPDNLRSRPDSYRELSGCRVFRSVR